MSEGSFRVRGEVPEAFDVFVADGDLCFVAKLDDVIYTGEYRVSLEGLPADLRRRVRHV